MSKYTEKFKSPKWQKLRLEIMERDNFTCVACGDKDKTLNVHHGYYEKGKDPWEYPLETLWTVCERCHKTIKDRIDGIHKMIGRIMPGSQEWWNVVKCISAMSAPTLGPNAITHPILNAAVIVADELESLAVRIEEVAPNE